MQYSKYDEYGHKLPIKQKDMDDVEQGVKDKGYDNLPNVQTLKKINTLQHVLDIFKNTEEQLSYKDIQNRLEEQGYTIPQNRLYKYLQKLCEKKLLEKSGHRRLFKWNLINKDNTNE